MIHASEAEHIAISVNNDIIDKSKEMKVIYKAIEQKAKCGSYSIVCRLNDQQKNRLKVLCYKVKLWEKRCIGDSEYLISWGE